MWGGGAGQQNGAHHPQGSLSVVTTVWGVTQATQSGPFNQSQGNAGYSNTNTTMSSTPYTQPPAYHMSHMKNSYGNPQGQGPPGGMGQFSRQTNPAAAYRHKLVVLPFTSSLSQICLSDITNNQRYIMPHI